MRIPCPFCGPRDVSEFTYRGLAADPQPEGADSDAVHGHVYLRDNPAGLVRERWYHTYGCRSWIAIERDTRTHIIAGQET